LTFAYSVWLKHEPVLDLAAVACGFVLRAIAGGIAVGVSISPWFLIVAGAGSLFMVTGKRSAELRSLGSDAGTRRSLDGYTESFLGYVRAVASSVAILAYCLWAFEKSDLVGTPAWFQLSIIPFALGILRYALLLDQDEGDGAPEELVLSDRVLLVIGAVWVLLFAVAVHGG
jgi:decaprenyl-phosphate phosphoribosyltransferase